MTMRRGTSLRWKKDLRGTGRLGGGREPWLDLYIQTVKEDIVKNIKTQYKKNLSKREEAAVKDLLLDDSIVIRPADKGSGVVVLDAKD